MNVQSVSAYLVLAAIEGALVAGHQAAARGSSAGRAPGGPLAAAAIIGRTRTARAGVVPVARAA